MVERANALLALWNDVAPELDDAYNDWHANEHVPERLTVPGMLWGRRYGKPPQVIDAPQGAEPMPRYLMLYGLRDAAVLQSEPYLELLRAPTPMSRSMRPALRNISRWVCTLHEDAGVDDATWLAVWALSNATAEPSLLNARLAKDRARLLARRQRDAKPLPWLDASQNHSIDGDWLCCTAVEQGSRELGADHYARLVVG
jgi:hypothetical protein